MFADTSSHSGLACGGSGSSALYDRRCLLLRLLRYSNEREELAPLAQSSHDEHEDARQRSSRVSKSALRSDSDYIDRGAEHDRLGTTRSVNALAAGELQSVKQTSSTKVRMDCRIP